MAVFIQQRQQYCCCVVKINKAAAKLSLLRYIKPKFGVKGTYFESFVQKSDVF